MNQSRIKRPIIRTDETVLTVEEAAELLKISTKTIREKAAQGLLPGRMIGQAWRFRRDSLLRFITPDDPFKWTSIEQGLPELSEFDGDRKFSRMVEVVTADGRAFGRWTGEKWVGLNVVGVLKWRELVP